MNAKDFSAALGKIGDDYLAEAIDYAAPKRRRANWLMWVAAAACLCVILAAVFKPRQEVSALTVDEVIEKTFDSLGVTDALFVDMEYPDLSEHTEEDLAYIAEINPSFFETCRIYYSQSEQLYYYFFDTTGKLDKITYWGELEKHPEREPNATHLSIDQVQEMALEYAKKCFGSHLIGELVVTRQHDSNLDYNYTITEYYQGQETGTDAVIFCTYDGRVSMAFFNHGKIYCRNGDGEIVLASDQPFIEEQAAIDTAMALTEEKATERGNKVLTDSVTVELQASGDQHYYKVSIDTLCEHDYIMTYFVRVDVYSGEILSYEFTQ